MREMLQSLIGVPAVIVLTAGLGIMVVTLLSRLGFLPSRPQIRWAHFALGIGLTSAGVLLILLDVSLFAS